MTIRQEPALNFGTIASARNRRRWNFRHPVFLIALMVTALVSASFTSPAAEPATTKPIPPGDARGDTCSYGVVFYYAPAPLTDPRATAQELLKQFLPDVIFSTDLGNRPESPFVAFEEEKAPLKTYPVPDDDYLKSTSRDLSEKDITDVQSTTLATALVLISPKEKCWSHGYGFTAFAQAYAEKTGAFIWDCGTRECLTREAWRKRRLGSWPKDGIPDISHQIVIQLYHPEKSSYLRAITFGMDKFALPDLVIERVTGSDSRPAGNLINMVCQSLAERPVIKDGAKELFSLAALQNESMRTDFQKSQKAGATGEILLALLDGQRQDGDADNRLFEIDFRNGVGATEDERRISQLASFWGAVDSVSPTKHSKEVLEASRQARKKLIKIQAQYRAGLPAGSRLLVKAPFARDDEGSEWMWVEVTDWPPGKSLEGLLQNDPFHIRKLKAGAPVRIKVDEIFDFMIRHDDGTSEGNETGKLMDKQGADEKGK